MPCSSWFCCYVPTVCSGRRSDNARVIVISVARHWLLHVYGFGGTGARRILAKPHHFSVLLRLHGSHLESYDERRAVIARAQPFSRPWCLCNRRFHCNRRT